ncbi:unnamed protein product, partial [marine sediment metagenome]
LETPYTNFSRGKCLTFIGTEGHSEWRQTYQQTNQTIYYETDKSNREPE